MSTNRTDLKLSSPRLRVLIGDPDAAPDSWTEHEIQTIGRDTVNAETLFGVRKFGRPIDHPVRSLCAMAYYALIRTGKISGSFDDFEQAYIEIQPVSEDVAFPTEPEPVPG